MNFSDQNCCQGSKKKVYYIHLHLQTWSALNLGQGTLLQWHQSLERCRGDQSSEKKRLCSQPYTEYLHQSATPASMNSSEKQLERMQEPEDLQKCYKYWHLDMTWLSHMWPDTSCGFLRMMDTYTTQQKSLHRYGRLSPDHTLLRSYRKLIVAWGERITVKWECRHC